MKIISMYLPQYHRVKENDEWWGEGFTDWVTTKEATPLYDNHYEPHIPLNCYYYDLTQKESFIWQSNLMKKYGVDGQCFYHYWFKDGRQILERPAELLLNWKDIDMPFCFSWANQTWARSWTKLQNVNSWCDTKEKKNTSNVEDGILLEQDYGDVHDWKEHFNYLLPFFKDSRYIKYMNKPVFVLYQACYIDILAEMKEAWNNWAKEEGFDGIFFIGANNRDETIVDSVLYPAPQYGLTENDSEYLDNGLRTIEYSKVWENIINFSKNCSHGTIGAFVSYDDTPRRGRKGCVVKNTSSEIFENCLTTILAINKRNKQPFTFINAWNEWGEGMHLEPDERFGESFLQSVKNAKRRSKDVFDGFCLSDDTLKKKEVFDVQLCLEKCNRYESYWKILNKWLLYIENGMKISNVIFDMGYEQIAVYGLGMLGNHLIHELERDNIIKIKCGFDRKDNIKQNEYNFPIVKIQNITDKNILVIVTVTYDYEAIKKELIDNGFNNVVSLKDIIK